MKFQLDLAVFFIASRDANKKCCNCIVAAQCGNGELEFGILLDILDIHNAANEILGSTAVVMWFDNAGASDVPFGSSKLSCE